MVQGRVEAVRRFSKSKMHWVSSTLAEAAGASAGFFRIRRDWDWVSLIKSSAQDAALIDDRAGRMAASAKCKVVRWNRDTGLLSLASTLQW
jgi:glycine cleavage system regulatory protein